MRWKVFLVNFYKIVIWRVLYLKLFFWNFPPKSTGTFRASASISSTTKRVRINYQPISEQDSETEHSDWLTPKLLFWNVNKLLYHRNLTSFLTQVLFWNFPSKSTWTFKASASISSTTKRVRTNYQPISDQESETEDSDWLSKMLSNVDTVIQRVPGSHSPKSYY